jgi:hypothetical protein
MAAAALAFWILAADQRALGSARQVASRPRRAVLAGTPNVDRNSSIFALPFDGPSVTRYCRRAVTPRDHDGACLAVSIQRWSPPRGLTGTQMGAPGRLKPHRLIANCVGADGVCG